MKPLAKRCRQVFENAAADLGNDLGGWSVLDLCIDNICAPTEQIIEAIVASGIADIASPRIKARIEHYAERL